MLCDVCASFDVRRLFFLSKPKRSSASPNLLANAIPEYFKHYAGISQLIRSAESNCDLCTFICSTWTQFLKTQGSDLYPLVGTPDDGQLYIGCPGWSPERQGLPYIVLSQRSSMGHLRSVCHFEAFVKQERLPPDGVDLIGRDVVEDSASQQCLSIAANWLSACLDTHTKCINGIRDPPLPTRVIDVGASDGSGDPKMVTLDGRGGSWAALSYCWGGRSNFVLETRTAERLQQGVPLLEFPDTIRDAVVVTRFLGIRYLWVDALCIKQDDQTDWEAEAACMRDVYKNARVTIAATASHSSDQGLFSRRPTQPTCKLTWRIPGWHTEYDVFLRPGSQFSDSSFSRSRLNTRGWALQESLLTPRTLSFGPQQMLWECSTHQSDESGRSNRPSQSYREKQFMQNLISSPCGLPMQSSIFTLSQPRWWKNQSTIRYDLMQGLGAIDQGNHNPYSRWFDIVNQYTSRSLTVDTDILPALSGLAHEFGRLTDDQYCAGLWRKALLPGLLWTRLPIWVRDGLARFDDTKPSAYRAPSWSWASINGRSTSYVFSEECIAETVAKVRKVHTITRSTDPYGALIGGYLTLCAPLIRIHDFRHTTREQPLIEYPKFQEWISDQWAHVRRFEFEFAQQHQDSEGQHFAVAVLYKWKKAPGPGSPGYDFLVLESTTEEGKYRRLHHLTYYRMGRDAIYEDEGTLKRREEEVFKELAESMPSKCDFTII